MVEPHLPGFVDDDGGIRHVGRGQDALEQAGFSAAEKPRQDCDGRLGLGRAAHAAAGFDGALR